MDLNKSRKESKPAREPAHLPFNTWVSKNILNEPPATENSLRWTESTFHSLFLMTNLSQNIPMTRCHTQTICTYLVSTYESKKGAPLFLFATSSSNDRSSFITQDTDKPRCLPRCVQQAACSKRSDIRTHWTVHSIFILNI